MEGRPSAAALERLRQGVVLDDGPTAPAQVQALGGQQVELIIHEGRKRQVRRMLAAVGHRVRALQRVGFANLDLTGLAEGQWRPLAGRELVQLRRLVGLEGD